MDEKFKFLMHKLWFWGGGYFALKKGSSVATPCFTQTDEDDQKNIIVMRFQYCCDYSKIKQKAQDKPMEELV